MAEQERIRLWLLETVRLMVDRPNDVNVQLVETDPPGDLGLRVHVHATEVGKVVGKQGRTARALRVIGSAIAVGRGIRFMLDVVQQ